MFVNNGLSTVIQDKKSKNVLISSATKEFKQYYQSLSYKLPHIIDEVFQQSSKSISKFLETGQFFANNLNDKAKLVSFLKNINKPEQRKESLYAYEHVLTCCQNIIAFKIEDIIQGMTEKDHQDYLTIIDFNNSMLIDKVIQKTFQDLTLQKMVKIDALSIFFRKNLELKKRYGKYFKNAILTNQVLAQVFKYLKSFVNQHSQRYNLLYPFIGYHLEEEFQPIASLLCLNQFKYRLSYSKRAITQQQFRKQASYSFMIYLKKQSVDQSVQFPFSFKFCEIVYFKKDKRKKININQTNKRIIRQKLRQIEHSNGQKAKEQFLQLALRWNLSLLQAFDVYSQFKIEENAARYNKEKTMNPFSNDQ